MIFGKRFLSITSLTGLVSLATAYSSKWFSLGELDSETLLNIQKISAVINDLPLNDTLDKNISTTKNPFLYSLFSTNLNSFVKSFHNHFYSWFLFNWGDTLLNNSSDSFLDSKVGIYNSFVNNKFSYSRPGADKLTPLNWSNSNNNISSSRSVLEDQFDKVIFDKLFTKKAGSDTKLAFDQSAENIYKNKEYVEEISKFQNHLFEEWFKQESPFILCQKDWNFSSKLTKTKYGLKESEVPDTPNFNFPDFDTEKSSLKTFNEKLKTGGFCTSAENKLFKISDLTKMDDGYKLSGILYRNSAGSSIWSKLTHKSTMDFENDPLGPFIVAKHEQSWGDIKKWEIDSSIFKQPNGNKGDKTYLLVTRDTSAKDTYGTYIRTKTGITFVYKNKKHDDVKKFLLNTLDKTTTSTDTENGNSDKLVDFDLKNELKAFFKSKPGEILASYLGSNTGSKFLKKSALSSWTGLLKSTSEFASTLSKNRNYWKLLSTLSSSVKDSVNIDWKKGTTVINPVTSAGLATPILFSRNLNKTSQLEEADWLDKVGNKNDGNYPALFKPLYDFDKKDSLYNASVELKKNLKETLSNLIINVRKTDKTSFLLNNYIFDNVFYNFNKDSKLMSKTIRNIALLNEMNFDFFKNSLGDFSSKLVDVSGLPNSSKEAISNFIKESIVEVFYGNEYLGEKIEDRVNYGGYQFTEVDKLGELKFCLKKIKTGSNTATASGESGNCDSSSNKKQENRKQWLQKLKNYWLLKNYHFNDYAYEIHSDLTDKYIHFLYSIYWLSKDGFKNLREFAISKIPSNSFGALVWTDNVENSAFEKASSGQDSNGKNRFVGKMKTSNDDSQGSEEIENSSIYFRDAAEDDIFNPYFSIDNERSKNSKEEQFPLNTGHITAYAKTGDNEYTEFSGFKGLITEDFAPDFDKGLYHVIFNRFDKANPAKNKSFSGTSSTEQVSTGIAFGTLFDGSKKTIDEVIDSFHTHAGLIRFLDSFFPSESAKIKTWRSDKSSSVSLTEEPKITLSELKEKAKQEFKSSTSKYQKAIDRFSGFLQNPEESIFPENKYFIPQKTEGSSSNKGHIVYMIQVNKYDFGSGFVDLIKTIGLRTLLKTVIVLPIHESTRIKSISDSLIKKNIIF